MENTQDPANSPFEFLAICTNNDGEAVGRPVADLLNKKEFYRIRNFSKGKLYGDQMIGKVYDMNGNHLKFAENIDYMIVQERFAIIDRVCLN